MRKKHPKHSWPTFSWVQPALLPLLLAAIWGTEVRVTKSAQARHKDVAAMRLLPPPGMPLQQALASTDGCNQLSVLLLKRISVYMRSSFRSSAGGGGKGEELEECAAFPPRGVWCGRVWFTQQPFTFASVLIRLSLLLHTFPVCLACIKWRAMFIHIADQSSFPQHFLREENFVLGTVSAASGGLHMTNPSTLGSCLSDGLSPPSLPLVSLQRDSVAILLDSSLCFSPANGKRCVHFVRFYFFKKLIWNRESKYILCFYL